MKIVLPVNHNRHTPMKNNLFLNWLTVLSNTICAVPNNRHTTHQFSTLQHPPPFMLLHVIFRLQSHFIYIYHVTSRLGVK